MYLKNIRHPQIDALDSPSFILPLGSTEQHGPFAPFGTDTFILEYLLEQVKATHSELIILPMLEFSRAQEHRDFYGTIFLTEETLLQVITDICASISSRAKNIFITSFHNNDKVINRFITEVAPKFAPTKITALEIFHSDDDQEIEKLLAGPMDDHAGNTEISNMLALKPETVITPTPDYPKQIIDHPFATDNLRDKSSTGIADNHPQWITNPQLGQQVLDLYAKRLLLNLEQELC